MSIPDKNISAEHPGPERSGVPPGTKAQGDAAMLTPLPGESSSSASRQTSGTPPLFGEIYDSETLVDQTLETSDGRAGRSPADAPTLLDAGPIRKPDSRLDFTPAQPMLSPGTVLGHRYEIVAMLGEGGMGTVYKATDRELNRPVAIKVIRPELARNRAIIERFKQELLLAHQVTHKNVIRIYDLGEAEHVKFITMEYIDGENLRDLLLRKNKLAPEEAVEIMQQVCRALDAAHSVGIIHRDLKPQNVMRDKTGRILVMDFGLARTIEGESMTNTGALVGTLDYMSPEQALAHPLDQRSDVYTVGLIFYELLTGKVPFKADSLLASLIKRTQERAASVSDHDAAIPSSLSNIVGKCLERDVKMRYQSATELLADLEAWQAKPAGATLSFHANVGPWAQSLPWPTITTIATVILLAALGWLWKDTLLSPRPRQQLSAGSQISLAIIPFRNASGDSSLDWVGSYLAETLGTDVGQSSSVRTVSSDRIRQLLHVLQLTPSSSLEDATIRRLGALGNAQVLVWGQYVRLGDRIRIDASVQDLKRDRTTPLKVEAPDENALPSTVDHLAQAIRENLSLPVSVIMELQGQAFKPSSRSLSALRAYNEGLELMRVGSYLGARKRFEAATNEDPEFALAYARLGQALSILGHDNEAESVTRKAVELSRSLPAPEKYRIATIHAWTMRDYSKAIDGYENLAKVNPEDTEVQSALGALYLDTNAPAKASERYQKLLDLEPNSMDALFGMGRAEIARGNPQGSFDYLNRALTLSIQFGNDEEKALILHAVGVAYVLLDKPDEALRNFQEALAIDRRLEVKSAIARNLNRVGQIMDRLGKSDEALKNYNEALRLRREIADKRGISDTLIDLGNLENERGQYGQAMPMFKESLQIKRDLGDENSQALDLNNIGNVYFAEADYQAALTFYQQALQLREKMKVPADVAETVHNLGDTDLRMGQFDQALTYYLRALDLYRSADDKRDAAIESHSTAEVFKYQGRYGAALKAEDEALSVFRQLQDHGSWLGDILSGYGNALSLLGRGDEAQKSLDEARDIAHAIKSDPLAAQILNFQGDRFFYTGDLKSAKSEYQQALRAASHTTDRDKVLVSKLNLAKVSVAEGNSRDAIKVLRGLAAEADTSGLKYFSLECSVYLAKALISVKDYSLAKQELAGTLDKSDKLGARMLLIKSHFLLADVFRLTGNSPEASSHYREAVRLLDEISKEPGADKVIERTDLKPIYQESTRWLQAANNLN